MFMLIQKPFTKCRLKTAHNNFWGRFGPLGGGFITIPIPMSKPHITGFILAYHLWLSCYSLEIHTHTHTFHASCQDLGRSITPTFFFCCFPFLFVVVVVVAFIVPHENRSHFHGRHYGNSSRLSSVCLCECRKWHFSGM